MVSPKCIKPYRMLYLSGGRGMIFSRLSDGTVIAIAGDLDRWNLVMPERTRTRRVWASPQAVVTGGAK